MTSPYTITTKLGHTYQRRAWTGGDKPDIDFENDPIHKDLIEAFYDETVAECGGLDLWECAGTSIEERKKQFHSWAVFDAWRTLNI